MAREILHRIVVNDIPTVHRLEAADYYRHPLHKKPLVGRVNPANVAAVKFHYLFAKYGPVKVAEDYLGIVLTITTVKELEANSQWFMTNDIYRSTRVKPQTLAITAQYGATDIVLLVPRDKPRTKIQKEYQIDFMLAFFYVLDHFPTGSEEDVRDPNVWKLWLGRFVAGHASEGSILTAEMADHIQSLDKTMASWYPRA